MPREAMWGPEKTPGFEPMFHVSQSLILIIPLASPLTTQSLNALFFKVRTELLRALTVKT